MLGCSQFRALRLKENTLGKLQKLTDAGRTVGEFRLLVKRNKTKIADGFQPRDD